MKMVRLFTNENPDPFHGIKFSARDCEIREDGEIIFSAKGYLFPENWSQSACDIAAQKYFRKPGPGFAGEKDLRLVIRRIVGAWKFWGEKLRYFSTPEDAQVFHDEHCFLLSRQMLSPNSPQWFNTGLHFAYGISGSAQGHYFVDEKIGKAVASTSAYERPQVHACFIQSVTDDLVNPMGIMDLWVREARVFKFGSGTGTNFSCLRAAGEPLEGGGITSGLMAFLKVGDVAAGSVKSGGVTRRAAKMVCLDLDHPEILDFVRWKANEEWRVAELVAGSRILRMRLKDIWEKSGKQDWAANDWSKVADDFRSLGLPLNLALQARELGRQGIALPEAMELTIDWRGEGYRAVFGQNANNSVRVPSAFLKALKEKGNWELKARKGGGSFPSISAEILWSEIAQAAWISADPGVQFEDLIADWHTCPNSGQIQASNPCSEYLFLDDTGCNLASLNLLQFWDEHTKVFDCVRFAHACRLATIALDISVSMAQYPSPQIAERSVAFRTLGLGFANLGALLMANGIAYDSEAGRAFASGISSLLAASAWDASSEMAESLGAFKEYVKNQPAVLRVLKNHAVAAGALNEKYEGLSVSPRPIVWKRCPDAIVESARARWRSAIEKVKKHGVRNAQLTAIAPTGTIGLVMDCDTTGIEPEYSLLKQKTLAGGGKIFSTTRVLSRALKSLGYSAADVNQIESFFQMHSTLNGVPKLKPEHFAVFDCAQGVGPGGGRISVAGHLGMLAAVQPFISGGISKTVSLPNEATIEDVKSVFHTAYEWMIKCVAIYRDGSKLSQPLNESRSNPTNNPEICFECG